MKTHLVHGARWAAIMLALLITQTIGGMISGGLLADSMPATFFSAKVEWLSIITTAALEAFAVYCLLTGLRVGRKHQIWILFAFYWGTKFFQMWIEATFFLNVWQTPPLMSWPELAFMLLYGTVTAALFAPLAVWIANARPAMPQQPLILPPLGSVFKVAIVYVPIYFVAGMVLAIPLAGPAFAATYEHLHVPAWLPLFQFARGMLWALILWLVIANHNSERDSRVTTAVALGTVSSFQLLQPNPYMQDLLRAAHLVEVLVSMCLFGWIAAWIYKKKYLSQSLS